MAVYLVTWDLNRQKPNYAAARQRLIDHLSQYVHIKDPGLDSVWFIDTSLDANSLSNDIRTKLDNNDKLVVTKMNRGQNDGWLQTNVWEWINSRM